MTRLESIEQLDEFRLKDVQAAVGQNTDPNARAKIIADLAVKNQLPGLYDPVDGEFVTSSGSRGSVPSKDVDMKLQSKGLIPPNSHSSSFLGRISGVSGDTYDKQIRDQSAQYNTAEDHREFNQEHIAKLGELLSKLKVAKPDPVKQPDVVKPPPTSTTGQADPNAGTNTGTVPQPNLKFDAEVQKMQNAILQKDPNALPKYHADGKLGPETIGAMQKYPDIAKQFPNVGKSATQANANVQNNANSSTQAESFSLGLGNALVESFGYETDLDEYSMNQFTTDVGAGARGLGNGLTFGYGDNILAGAKAGLGIEKDYKTALGKEMANTARAKSQSSSAEFNNPLYQTWLGDKLGADKTFKVNAYDVGDIAGTIGAPIPGGLVANGLVRGGGLLKGMARLGIDAGVNFGTAVVADITKAIHDKATTGVTQPLVDKLINMNPAIIKQSQAKAGLPQTGKLDPATLDFMGKIMEINEAFDNAKQVPLTESEKMSELKKRLSRLDEASRVPGSDASAKFIEKMLGIGAADVMKMTQKEFDAAFSAALNKNISKVEKRIPAPKEPTVRNNVSNNSSSSVNGGNITQNANPVINIHVNGAGPITAAEKTAAPKVIAQVEKEVSPVVAKELDAAVKTGDKKAIGTWWERNKGRAKWSTGLLGLLGLIGIGGLLAGGHENDNTTTTTTTTIPPGPDGKCPPGYKLGTDGKSCVPDSTVVNPNPAPDAKPMCSLEQMDLIRQIKDEMTALNKENGGGPMGGEVQDAAVAQALARAQEVMDAALAGCTQPTGSEQNANPAPAGVNMSGTVSLPGNVKSGMRMDGGPSGNYMQQAESADAELNRWLKIARG